MHRPTSEELSVSAICCWVQCKDLCSLRWAKCAPRCQSWNHNRKFRSTLSCSRQKQMKSSGQLSCCNLPKLIFRCGWTFLRNQLLCWFLPISSSNHKQHFFPFHIDRTNDWEVVYFLIQIPHRFYCVFELHCWSSG